MPGRARMKLTLIHPAVGKVPGQRYIRAWQMEPLPVAHLAGMTPPEIELNFFDDRMETIDFDRPTDLVALSVETYTALRAYQIASEYRRRGVPVVMGGFHPTLCPTEVGEYAEAVVSGEAENVWPELLNDFAAGRLKRYYRSTGGRPALGLNQPKRSIYGNRNYLPINLVEASRGCTFNCDFCVIQSYFNSTQISKSIAALVDEIKSLPHRNRLTFLVDDNAVSRPEVALELFEALIPLKIKWVSQSTITLARDRRLVRTLKASGCQGVLIGFESLNQESLRQMNKSFNASRGGAREAVRLLHSEGIRIYGTFIFGYDGETIDSFGKTLDFCRDEKLFMVAFNHLTPFPGTPLYDRLEREGRLLFDRWWLDPSYRYGMVPFKTTLSAETIRRECIKARQAFYSSNSILRRFTNPANCAGPAMIFPYFFINFLLRNDISQRCNLPLGDDGWKGELIKVSATALDNPAFPDEKRLTVS
jgi:radical SAM superfamily enzyme YgiQ (UPF0313 family)